MLSSKMQTEGLVQAIKTTKNKRVLRASHEYTHDIDRLKNYARSYEVVSQSGIYVVKSKLFKPTTAKIFGFLNSHARGLTFMYKRVFLYIQESQDAPWIHCGLPHSFRKYCRT